jgi:hypothetical protein
VTPDARDPWRLPSVPKYGAQLRDLENANPLTHPVQRPGFSWRPVLVSGGAIAAALCVVLVLSTGHSAQAQSAVNAAPAAAERSGSVRFQSALTITVNGDPRPGISEQGAIDFANSAYTTTVSLDNTGQALERRSVNGVVYSANRRRGRHAQRRTVWTATHLAGGTRGAFASESDAFTDPPSVFRTLAGIRAPVRRLGHANVDGVPTTHYQLLTNLAAFLRPSSGYVQNPFAYRGVKATLDVWLDAKGRPQMVKETFTGPSSVGPATLSTVVSFSDYERPVSVQAPPSSVVSFTTGTTAPNPLAAGPAPLLPRLLFSAPAPAPAPPASAGQAAGK